MTEIVTYNKIGLKICKTFHSQSKALEKFFNFRNFPENIQLGRKISISRLCCLFAASGSRLVKHISLPPSVNFLTPGRRRYAKSYARGRSYA